MTRPEPLRVLVGLLRLVSSRDAANAAIGDILDEHAELTTAGQAPLWPSLWINTRTLNALGATMIAGLPRMFRTTGLTIRDAVRALRHSPAQSLFITFILAVGIAAGTITFSVVDAVVLRPLPFDHPEQLVSIGTSDKTFKQRITANDFQKLRDGTATLERVATQFGWSGDGVRVGSVTSDPTVTYTTSDLFQILHLTTEIGRLWNREDEAQDPDVAVLGYRFWKERLLRDPTILGQTVVRGSRTFRVIGVLAEGSNSPDTYLTSGDLWVPQPMSSGARFALVARMRPGVTTTDVAAELQRAIGSADWTPTVASQLDGYVAGVRDWMLLALGAAGFVVLIACVNAANVMLTRATHRSQEMAIRASLGASPRQIALSMLTEGLLLSMAASTCALLFAFWGVGLARTAITSMLRGVFRASSIALNGRVLVAAVAAAVMTGLLFSLVPAWQTSRTSVLTLLKDAGPMAAGGRRRWRSVFLVAEVASVGVLLVVSWLFVSSMIHSISVDLGVDRTNLIAVKHQEFAGTADEVEQRIRQVPGVSAIAMSAGGASLPLVGRAFDGAWITTSISRGDGTNPTPMEALLNRVTPNYFEVAGLRFRRGSTWTAEPAANVSAVVLDDIMATRMFGSSDPIGQQVRAKEPEGVFTVTGVVTHVRAWGPEAEDLPAAYFPIKPNPARKLAGFFVKTSTPAANVLPVIVQALEPFAPNAKPYIFLADDAVSRITATRRFNAWLMLAFGCVGMLIAAAGIYAVMASIVAQQTREIGVRIALGATPQVIQRNVLGLAAKHLLVGLAIGLPAGWLVSRGSATLFFRVTPTDASVYIGVAVLLTMVGFAAVLIPARRASRVDPITSLRA